MTDDEFLAKFRAPRRSGKGFRAHCPAHEDRQPSLSITFEGDRRLLHCHAKCEIDSILEAAGLTKRDLFAQDRLDLGVVIATYGYRDEAGVLLSEVLRYEPKAFRQRRPDGAGGWIWKLDGVRRVPYRLPDLKGQARVFVVEGEKDADLLWHHGLPATTNAGGAGKWTAEHSRCLAEAGISSVVVIADNDEPGERHARDVAANCHQEGLDVRSLSLPGLPEGGDVSDYLGSNSLDELLELVNRASRFNPDDGGGPDNTKQGQEASSRGADSAATTILRGFDALIDRGAAELFHTKKNDAYVSLIVEDRRENYALKSTAFRHWLASRYYKQEGKAPNGEALRSAIETLIGHAIHAGPEYAVAVRVAEGDNAVYVDLGDPTWRCVEVTAEGWRIIANPPVRFRRPPNLRPLPEPIMGGDLSEIFEFVNVPDPRQQALLLSWIVAAIHPTGPHPILVLHGGQGSAKSTLASFVKTLIDPAAPLLRSAPHDERDLAIAVSNSKIVAFDNLSSIPSWLSDALCRIATGGGIAARELYTDDEETVFELQNPIILNGIEELASRADLLDRSIILSMPPIPAHKRRDEARLKAEFARSHPALLGAVLTALCAGLRNRNSVELPSMPRMADFARIAVAAEPALNLPPGSFMAAYAANIAEANDSALESSAVATALLDFLKPGDPVWEGSATQLLEELAKRVSENVRREKHWPKSPRGLVNALARVGPNLEQAGIKIQKSREGHNRKRILTIWREAESSSASSASVSGENSDEEPADGSADGLTPPMEQTAEYPEDFPDISTFEDDADGADGDGPEGDSE